MMIGFSAPGRIVFAIAMAAATVSLPVFAGEGMGLAAKFPGDAGLERHPSVIMADNFESWGADGTTFPKSKWDSRNKKYRTRVMDGKVTSGGVALPGAKVLEMACWNEGGGSQSAGLTRKLGNYESKGEGRGDGLDEVYVRFYMKFSDNYEGVRNHGANLGGRDVTRGGSRWVGMSNTRDVAAQGYFYSGLQPYGKGTDLQMGFYNYHCDKPNQWGDVRKGGSLKPGRWYCIERRMKLNSAPDKKDGCEELWLDGKKVIDWQGVRFRKVMHLKITYFQFGTYYHGLPAKFSKDNPIAVFFDNVVVAKEYIGPVSVVPARISKKPEANSPGTPAASEASKKRVDGQKAAKLYRAARDAERRGMKSLAKQLYERIVKEYPKSEVASAARKKLGIPVD